MVADTALTTTPSWSGLRARPLSTVAGWSLATGLAWYSWCKYGTEAAAVARPIGSKRERMTVRAGETRSAGGVGVGRGGSSGDEHGQEGGRQSGIDAVAEQAAR